MSKLGPCDVNECESEWCVVVYIREGEGAPAASGTQLSAKRPAVKHSVKLCAPHYKEFRAEKTPTLRG